MAFTKQIARKCISGKAPRKKTGYKSHSTGGVRKTSSLQVWYCSTPLPASAARNCSRLQTDLCFQSAAIGALQEVSEATLAGLFEDSNLCTLLAKRVTIMPKDIQIACCIHGERA
ncbi:histone H3.3-like [Nannospalax galili]|uniref:histone H3.3-like n=1 Tax=Nannospalax galili TaxID=1026970 RepID=UPI0004ED2BF3|nr:histone H3.3-like [Nannospalax galili]